jgi:hypothetical protein
LSEDQDDGDDAKVSMTRSVSDANRCRPDAGTEDFLEKIEKAESVIAHLLNLQMLQAMKKLRNGKSFRNDFPVISRLVFCNKLFPS